MFETLRSRLWLTYAFLAAVVLWGAGCIALILALILAYGMVQWVAAPQQCIVLGARQVVAGKYHPIQPEGPDEVWKAQ